MKDLIERLEKATGPDRALDYDIWKKCAPEDGWNNHIPEHLNWLDGACCQPFTSSIDAALTLVPEGRLWMIGKSTTGYWAQIEGPRRSDEFISGRVDTSAIALCIAALKARTVCKREGSKAKDTAPGKPATS